MTRIALVGAVDIILALSPFFRKPIPSSRHNFLMVPDIDFVTSSCMGENVHDCYHRLVQFHTCLGN